MQPGFWITRHSGLCRDFSIGGQQVPPPQLPYSLQPRAPTGSLINTQLNAVPLLALPGTARACILLPRWVKKERSSISLWERAGKGHSCPTLPAHAPREGWVFPTP